MTCQETACSIIRAHGLEHEELSSGHTELKYVGHVFLNAAHQTPSCTVLAAAVTPRPTTPSPPDPARSAGAPAGVKQTLYSINVEDSMSLCLI
ncbi:hypothetical protein EYF80_037902 [Liparis tanakae]|uniref:Uncharacterized protein n=1 Tax=Liparis tanakae TaxID=230148 RepID=A0A4Z2GE77_9TELE|nr:hypothetical protein EYF80_037902 [Liparis tanakae]